MVMIGPRGTQDGRQMVWPFTVFLSKLGALLYTLIHTAVRYEGLTREGAERIAEEIFNRCGHFAK